MRLSRESVGGVTQVSVSGTLEQKSKLSLKLSPKGGEWPKAGWGERGAPPRRQAMLVGLVSVAAREFNAAVSSRP